MAYYFRFQIQKIEILPFGAYLYLEDFYFQLGSNKISVKALFKEDKQEPVKEIKKANCLFNINFFSNYFNKKITFFIFNITIPNYTNFPLCV